MPGVDLQVLRERITMREVLRLLQFEATVRRGPDPRSASAAHWASRRSAATTK